MGTHYEQLLELAMQRATGGKGDLAASIAETCLATNAGLNETELSLTFDIVRVLIETVDLKIRRHLAAYLAVRDDVPPDLIAFLIDDDISVAYPILVNSRLLQDSALIDIVARRTKQHRLAVTVRPRISEAVCDALVQTGDADIVESLLYNGGASIQAETLDAIVDASRTTASLQLPLVRRSDLSAAQARRLYSWAGSALRRHILAHYDIDPEAVDSATAAAVEKALDEPAGPDEQPAALLDALHRGDRHATEVQFTARTRLDPASATKILYGRSARALAVACKGSNLSVMTYSKLLAQSGSEKNRTTMRESEKMTQAIAYFSRLERPIAKQTLEKWRVSPSTIWRNDDA